VLRAAGDVAAHWPLHEPSAAPARMQDMQQYAAPSAYRSAHGTPTPVNDEIAG